MYERKIGNKIIATNAAQRLALVHSFDDYWLRLLTEGGNSNDYDGDDDDYEDDKICLID